LQNVQILSAGTENLSQKVAELNKGKTYWKSFIIWTLIFLALEILILKFWRRKKKVPNAAAA